MQIASASSADVVDWCDVLGLVHLLLEFFIEGEHAWCFVDVVADTSSA